MSAQAVTVARVRAVVADLFTVPEETLSGASSPATVAAMGLDGPAQSDS